MGMTFTTAHIYNAQNLTKAQFKKAFTDMMKAKCYTASDEENAAYSYTLVFAPDRKWVTVLTDGSDTRREAAELAKGLKVRTVMIDLVDSDFAELSLFDEGGAHKDTLTLGDSYLEEAAPMGVPAVWQPLLCGSWEQVQEIQNGSYTFAEDALAQFAPLIGMDRGDILLDNDSADDNNAVVLYFKRDNVKEKKLTLKNAFVTIFGNKLEQLGFVRVKGKTAYIKIINDEIVTSVSLFGKNEDYNVYTGVSTIYDDQIRIIPDKYSVKYFSIWDIYIDHFEIYGRDHEYAERIKKFKCGYDNESIISSMNYAYEQFELIALPLLNKITDLRSMFWYFDNIHVRYFEKELYLKLDNFTDYFKALKNHLIDLLQIELKYHLNRVTEDNLKDKEKSISDRIQNGYIDFLQEIISDKEKYDSCMNDMEEYKKRNWETLRNLGISETAPSLNTDAAPAKEKKLTLNSAFVKVFGEALEPLGFVRLKGLKHIFARVKTDDIIQFITYIDKPTGIKGQKGFSIESAVMTMYRPTLDFKKWNSFLLNGFDSICGIYRADHLEDYDSKIWDDLYTTQYDENDESSIMDALSFTLDWVYKLILPEFEKIDDLSGTIKYLRKHNHSILISSEEEWKIHNENPNYYSEEDMLYIICGYNGDFREDIMNQAEFEHRQNIMKRLGFRIPSTETYEKYYNGKTTMAEKQYNKLSSLLSEKDYKDNCIKECECRKISNLETIKSFGFNTI